MSWRGREVKTLMCRVLQWGLLHRVMAWMRVSSDVRERACIEAMDYGLEGICMHATNTQEAIKCCIS